MSTGATLLVVAACWALAIGVPLTVLLLLRSQRRESDTLAIQVHDLRQQVTDLTDALERAEASARLSHGATAAGHDDEQVPVITAMPGVDDVDLSAARVASVTLARPLMKVAALSYGVRQALHEEHRVRIQIAMRRELRRQRKMRRRRRARRGPSEGWVR